MRVLVIGTGGREHAIVRALAADPAVTGLHAAPGNPGIGELAERHAVSAADPADVARLARRLGAGLVVIGPEAPLVAGVGDALRAAGIPVFGPDAGAARIEGSKAFAKEIMAAAGIPTAAARVCGSPAAAAAALDAFGPPYVVKDDALAAGKGVVVTTDRAAALAHAAGCGQVVIEEYLDGPEVSLFAVADGRTAVPLLAAQDFKRARDGDQGPNTGGMGAYVPLPWVPDGLSAEVMATVIQPALDELARRGTPYRGLLYAGLALTGKGVRVVEFNARFGDPETQVILDRLATPLGGLLHASAVGDLAAAPALSWRPGAAVTVVIAAEGYPDNPVKGDEIEIHSPERTDGYLLHAGTAISRGDDPPYPPRARPMRGKDIGRAGSADPSYPPRGRPMRGEDIGRAGSADPSYPPRARPMRGEDIGRAGSDGRLVTAGGRVLNAVGSGPDLATARAAAYAVAECARFRGGWYRHDIAERAGAGS